jgi:hypothetical protein
MCWKMKVVSQRACRPARMAPRSSDWYCPPVRVRADDAADRRRTGWRTVRRGASRLIPILSVMALCRGVRAHFVDHAFHLARRPNMMLWTYAPAALAKILLNLIAIPGYGPYGAACVRLVCQAGALAAGWVVGRRVFPIWLPLPRS